MNADGTATAQAMCPNCGTWNPWPPTGDCSACGAPLTGPLVRSIWDIDRQANDLQVRRRELLRQLRSALAERSAARPDTSPMPPPPTSPPSIAAPTPAAPISAGAGIPPPPPRAPSGVTGLRAQTILGLAGVGLLALAAIAFAAVTWRTLGPGVRVTILAAATLGASAIAVNLTARGLKSTGGALAGLATLLSFVTLLSAERLELLGDLGALSGTTLGFAAATVTAWALSGRWRPEPDPGVRIAGMLPTAQVTWGLAVTFGASWLLDAVTNGEDWLPVVAIAAAGIIWAAIPVLERSIVGDLFASLWVLVASVAAPILIVTGDGGPAALSAAAGVVATATWFGLARNRGLMPLGWFLTVSTTSGLLVGTVFRLVPDDHPQWTYAAVLAAFGMLVIIQATGGRSPIPAGWNQRGPAIGGLWPAVLPALAIAFVAFGEAATGLLVQAARPWRPAAHTGDIAPGGGHDAVAILGAVAVLMIILVTIWERHTRRLAAVALLLLAVGAPAALWQVEARAGAVWLAAIVPTAGLALLAAGLRDWLPATPDRAVLVPIAAITGFLSIGWIAGSRPGTLVGGSAAFLLAGALRFGPGGLRRGVAGVATDVLLVTIGSWSVAIVGATASDLLTLDPIVIGIVASVGATLGAWVLQPRLEVDGAWVILVGLAQLVTVAVALAADEPLAASSAAFAAALAMFVVGMRATDVTMAPATWAAIVHATIANGILLADRGVEVVEAYTAVPAGLLLALGAVRVVRDPSARSVPTLLPGLLVFVIPTVLTLVADPRHTGRALWLAAGSTTLLVIAVRTRLSAPVTAGAIGVGGVVLTQFPVVAAVVDGWMVIAVLGLVLVVISATYEARLRDVRRIREQVQSYR